MMLSLGVGLFLASWRLFQDAASQRGLESLPKPNDPVTGAVLRLVPPSPTPLLLVLRRVPPPVIARRLRAPKPGPDRAGFVQGLAWMLAAASYQIMWILGYGFLNEDPAPAKVPGYDLSGRRVAMP